MPRDQHPKDADLEKVRARIAERLATLHDVQDLEFVELAASLPEAPFDADAALEALLSTADYIAMARARYELELEKLRRTPGQGQEPM